MSDARIKITSAQAWAERKRLIILRIKEVIKNNQDVPMKKLVSLLVVEDPYISRDKAIEYLQDLFNTDVVTINDKDEVVLCQ